MGSRDLYDSGAIDIHDGQGEEFQLTVHARDGAQWERSATATLTFGTGTMFCFATLGEEDLRRLAGEFAHAANVIRRHEDGAKATANSSVSLPGKPRLTVVSES
ncbi:MAG: hypothetical protein AAF709_04325 [Pseudomonadota bacterium]